MSPDVSRVLELLGAQGGRSFNVFRRPHGNGGRGFGVRVEGLWSLGFGIFGFWGLGGRRLRFMDIGFGLRDHGLIRKFRPYALKP